MPKARVAAAAAAAAAYLLFLFDKMEKTLSAVYQTLSSATSSLFSQSETLWQQAFCRTGGSLSGLWSLFLTWITTIFLENGGVKLLALWIQWSEFGLSETPFPFPPTYANCAISWCDDCLPLFVDSLVRATIPQGALQQLDLDLNIYSFKQPLELPRSIFFCKTLVVLKLKGTLLLNPPSASTFPTLEILLLDSVRYANCDSLSTLLASSPVLQDFTLKLSQFRMDNLDKNAAAGKLNIIVLVPTLKFLLLHVECGSYKLHLNTPALKYFHFKGVLDEDVVLEKLPNLVKSVLQVETCYDTSDDDYAMRIWDFMGPLYNVISMELYINTAESLCHASNHDDDVPMFHNLSSLKIYGELWFKYAWHAVRLLLFRAPKLQTLTFELVDMYGSRCSDLDNCSKNSQDVPQCLSSHLTTCHYKGFSEHEDEMELVRQILKDAKVLRTMKITAEGCPDSKMKRRIHKELMKFPKSSQICQIVLED